MAIGFSSGVSYGGKVLGNVAHCAADDPARFSVEKTMEKAGMLWNVGKFPLGIVGGDLAGTPATGAFGIFRTDIWEHLGAVGMDYKELQNRDIFGYLQPFADAGALEFLSAGCVDNGKKVYVQAKLCRDDFDVGGGDKVAPYLFMGSSHNGTCSTSIGFNPNRIWCQNTLNTVLSGKGLLRVKHTRSQIASLDAIMATVNLANAQFEATCEQYQTLLACKINRNDLDKYVKRVLGVDPSEKMSTRMSNQFDKIVKLAIRGQGNSPGELTAWSAYNGVTEYTNHHRQNTEAKRFASVHFGTSATMGAKALNYAFQLAS